MKATRRIVVWIVTGALLGVFPPSPATGAEGPTPVWDRRLSFQPLDIATAPNGDVVIVGYEPARGPAEHLVVARLGADGEVRWRRTWADPDGWGPVGVAVAIADDGSAVVAGNLVEPTLGEIAHAHLWRFARTGRLAWHREVPSPPRARRGGFDVAGVAAGRGRVVVACQTYQAMAHFLTLDGWVEAFTDRGRRLWWSRFEVAGEAGRDGIGGIAMPASGRRVVVSGWVNRSNRADTGRVDSDVVLQMLAGDGRRLWEPHRRRPRRGAPRRRHRGRAGRSGDTAGGTGRDAGSLRTERLAGVARSVDPDRRPGVVEGVGIRRREVARLRRDLGLDRRRGDRHRHL